MTYSIKGEFQYATLDCLVENPPVAVVENEWHTASNQPMPPHTSNKVSETVRIK